MAENSNYATWMMYLIILNVVASAVFGALFAITNEPFDSATPQQPTDIDLPSGALDYSFGQTFLSSLIIVPLNLWSLTFPIGPIIVVFFGLLKVGIVICLYKIINPVSSG
jgi:hypothetical protein